jgi:hypothetical protein
VLKPDHAATTKGEDAEASVGGCGASHAGSAAMRSPTTATNGTAGTSSGFVEGLSASPIRPTRTNDPKATNPQSFATGLIQFMPKTTAPNLGTSREKLLAMSDVEQLDYVDKYFRNKDTGLPLRKYKNLNEVYLQVYLRMCLMVFQVRGPLL